jgi:hypothetical protein
MERDLERVTNKWASCKTELNKDPMNEDLEQFYLAAEAEKKLSTRLLKIYRDKHEEKMNEFKNYLVQQIEHHNSIDYYWEAGNLEFPEGLLWHTAAHTAEDYNEASMWLLEYYIKYSHLPTPFLAVPIFEFDAFPDAETVELNVEAEAEVILVANPPREVINLIDREVIDLTL